MITPKQKWALGGLLAVSGAVWTPQLAARLGDDTSASVVPDGPDAAEIAMMEQEFVAIVAGDGAFGGPGALPAGATGGQPRTGSEGPRSTGGPMGDGSSSSVPSASLSRGGGEVLGPDALVRSIADALGSGRTFGAAAPPMTPIALGRTDSSLDGYAPAEDDISLSNATIDFLDRHPLRGTVVGTEVRRAIFGSHMVAEGAKLPGTESVLSSVTRGHVVIDDATMSLEVDLPPLRASEERMRAAQRAASSNGGAEASTEAGSSAGAPAQPEPDAAEASSADAAGASIPDGDMES